MVLGGQTVRPGRGAPETQRGDRNGDRGDGKGFRERPDREGDGKGYRERPDRDGPPRDRDMRQHWRVNQGRTVIVREAVEVESATVCTLQSNALCAQIGDEVQFANGIVRMQIDTQ